MVLQMVAQLRSFLRAYFSKTNIAGIIDYFDDQNVNNVLLHLTPSDPKNGCC